MEQYLKEKHAEDYMGLDDEMGDSFDEWLIELGVDEWIKYAEEYKDNAVRGERGRIADTVRFIFFPINDLEKDFKLNQKYILIRNQIIKAINQQ